MDSAELFASGFGKFALNILYFSIDIANYGKVNFRCQKLFMISLFAVQYISVHMIISCC